MVYFLIKCEQMVGLFVVIEVHVIKSNELIFTVYTSQVSLLYSIYSSLSQSVFCLIKTVLMVCYINDYCEVLVTSLQNQFVSDK
jgi:hypothetical protein